MALEYKYEELPDHEQEMMTFMAKRLGFDHFIIAGYDSEEFSKHVLSRGWHDKGAPKISMNASLAGAAFIISRLLVDFDFSAELRRSVHSIINTVLTGREIEENRGDNERGSS